MATAPSENPIAALSHDHRHLTELILEVRSMLGAEDASDVHAELVDAVDRLRDELMTHFAREEEGLFPFVETHLADLRARVGALAAGHDRVCGSLARLSHSLGRAHAEPTSRAAAVDTFARFEDAYALHSRDELTLLADVDRRLDADARRELRHLLAGL